VKNFCHPTEFEDVSFTLRRGEILGFYGLVGAGRSEVMQALFGLTQACRHGAPRRQAARHHRPADAIAHGIAYVPEDRQHHGAHLTLPIMHNITLPILSRSASSCAAARGRKPPSRATSPNSWNSKAAHLTQNVSELSGGNQQKVVLGKWLATNPKVIILDEPTKGIDIGSKAAVHRFISELVARAVGDPGLVRTAGSAGPGRPHRRHAPGARRASSSAPMPRRKRSSRPHRAARCRWRNAHEGLLKQRETQLALMHSSR
jgi:rhamnose transport system ATP-binding protein